MRPTRLSGVRIGLVVALLLATFDAFMPLGAMASTGELKTTMIRLDNMSASTATKGTVCVEGETSTATDYLQVTFPTGFVLGTTANWATTTTPPSGPGTGSLYWPSSASGFPTSLTATNVTGQTVTFQYGTATNIALTATVYCFDWTNSAALTTSTAGTDLQGSVTLENATPAAVDVGDYALTVLTSNSITVTAVVPPIFEFTMPGTTDQFTTNLSPSAITTTTGVTPTIKTNAKGGWIMWAHDSNQALTSASSGGSIPSVGWGSPANTPTTLVAGTAGYALNVVKSVAGGTFCTETVDPEYDTVGHGSGNGGEFWSNWQQIGQCAGGPSNGDGLELQEEATIAVTTPASTDYTDTIYVTGAGLF